MANENYNRTSETAGGGSATGTYSNGAGQSPRSEEALSDGGERTAMEKAHQLQDMASEKATEVGAKLQDTADMGVNRAAEGLDQASVQLRERATEMGGVQEKLGVRMADGLDKTSGYLREHEANEIWTDVEKFVREHPMQAAVTAAVAGYVVAKVLK